jgi:hypothetical protein
MKIDKDIPIPQAFRRLTRKHHDLYEIVESMQVGDSFLAKESLIYKGVFSTKHAIERKYGIKLAQRKTPEGVRIWRTA